MTSPPPLTQRLLAEQLACLARERTDHLQRQPLARSAITSGTNAASTQAIGRALRCVERPVCRATMVLLTVLILTGCALPLAPATAPLAGAVWGVVIVDVLKDWTAPAAPVLIHAEAGPALTFEVLATGLPEADGDAVLDSTAWLALQGLTPQQMERGEVIMARIGWTGASPAARRSVYFPVLRGTQDTTVGSILEVRIGPTGPAVVEATRATNRDEIGCVYLDLPTDEPTVERLNGRWIGSPRMASVLTCPALHTTEWQRISIFWHREPPPAWPVRQEFLDASLRPSPYLAEYAPYLISAGLVFVYRNASVTAKKSELSLFIDGQSVGKLRDSDCLIFALEPGKHRIATGGWAEPRREINLLLATGQQVAIEFVIDDAVNNNLLLGLSNYRSYEERAFRLVQRPMLTWITGCSHASPASLKAAQPPVQ